MGGPAEDGHPDVLRRNLRSTDPFCSASLRKQGSIGGSQQHAQIYGPLLSQRRGVRREH